METTVAAPSVPSMAARLRYLLPLYIAGLVVTLCGIGAVSATLDDSSLGTLTVGLTVVGFVVSLVLRLSRVDPNLALYPAFGLGFFLIAQRFITAGSLLETFGGPVHSWQPDVALATFLCWLVVLRSFTLLTNYALLFCPVPTIALLGLTGSSNVNTEILVYFMVFLFATLFLVGYEHYLRLQQGARREPDPIFRAHAATALALFLAVTFAGCLLTLLGRPVLSQLSPFAGPLLRRAQQLPGFNQALQNQSNFVPVGSGPIDLSHSPVMDVYSSQQAPGLWRTRVMDYWNGRGWAPREPENPAATIATGPVAATRPPNLPPEETYRTPLLAIPLPRDRHRNPNQTEQRVLQQFVIKAPLSPAIPAAPRPLELRSQWHEINAEESGVMMGSMYINPGLTYEVISDVSEPAPDELRKAPPVNPDDFYQLSYLDLPNNLNRVRELARRITQNIPNQYDKALAIQSWLEQNCPYTLQEEAAPPGQDSVEYYLFTTREGACDLVGSAMALMCRSVGIPARVAVGYSNNERDETTGAFAISQADAHLWVELFFPGYGWATFNPAPPPRQTPPTASSSLANRARRMWRGLARGGLASALSVLLIAALVGAGAHTLNETVRGRLRGRRAEQQMFRSQEASVAMPLIYRRMVEVLGRHGWPRPETATPREYLVQLREGPNAPPPAALEAAATLTEHFTATRYAAAPPPPAEVDDARRRLADLEEALRGHQAAGGSKA